MPRSRAFTRLAAGFLLAAFAAPALADDSGLSILIDLQDPATVANNFCVYDSKLFSINASVCPTRVIKLTCLLKDEADPAKGLAWVAADDKTRCVK
jgi:hypothetical protein